MTFWQPPKNAHNLAGGIVRRLASMLQESQYSISGSINQARPVADPQSQTPLSRFSLNNSARILYGMITDGTAIGHVYRVTLEGVKQPVLAYHGSHYAGAITGVRDLTTLTPGTAVLCSWHEQTPYAHILSVLPSISTDARYSQNGILHGATRSRVDEAHKKPHRFKDGALPSFAGGRPFDATLSGEAGWMSDTGIRCFVDSFMAMIGLDEACQLSFHYHDMLCRLAAYQFQHWTSARETESYNDQDELQDWTGYAMYPWEQLGLSARADPTTIKTAQEWQQATPHYGKMEPLDDFLMPFHREREYHGYLGQGFKRCVVAPPLAFTENGDAGSTGQTDTAAGSRAQHLCYEGGEGLASADCPGLYDHFITADGRACFQSVKGFSITKRGTIITPTRRRRPEDPQGDSPENYKSSSLLGEGPEHTITGDLDTGEGHSGMTRAAGVRDLHSYLYNYAGLHPFFYHDKDYSVPEESEAAWVNGQGSITPRFGKLASEFYLSPEDYKQTWNIDHRYGEQQFYQTEAGLDMLEDGSVVISDGYGGSIRMSGGHIEISAPGDIWFRSGRNTNTWAGQDAVIRAKKSWDISATDGDGRLKTERNLMMLSGNGGIGGTLIESRGAGTLFDFDDLGEGAAFNGVVLRAAHSSITGWGNSVYLRTGGGNLDAGPIVLDAGKGQSPVVLNAQSVQNYTQGEFWHFGTQDEQVTGPAAAITATSAFLPGSTTIDGGLLASGGGVFGGSVAAMGSFAASQGAPYIGELRGTPLELVQTAIDDARQAVQQTIPQTTGQQALDAVIAPLHARGAAGDDEVILKGEFSFRTKTDYNTDGFQLYEDLWQQLSRLSAQNMPKWVERPVYSQGQETYPYPGTEAYQSGENYIQQSLTLFDATAGRSKDRGEQPELAEAYASPAFGQKTPTSLNEYTVIR